MNIPRITLIKSCVFSILRLKKGRRFWIDDFIKAVLTKSANQIRKEWSELTTKTKDEVNGRINKDTILVRVMAK